MANDGRSKTYKLLRKLLWDQCNIRVLQSDDTIAIIIKHYMNEYVNLSNVDFRNLTTREINKIHNKRNNIVYKINQIRLKNWYWENIKE